MEEALHVEVKLFAMLREAQGADRIALTLPRGATVGELKREIAARFPALAPFLPTTRLAAALRFVSEDHVLVGGQELALVPPVSGG
ncbi:Molybdopterin synthase sulfur carrier subunit [compost metagenome]